MVKANNTLATCMQACYTSQRPAQLLPGLQDFEGADVRFGDVSSKQCLRDIAFSEPVDVVVSCLASRTGGKVLHSCSLLHCYSLPDPMLVTALQPKSLACSICHVHSRNRCPSMILMKPPQQLDGLLRFPAMLSCRICAFPHFQLLACTSNSTFSASNVRYQ